jgi:hypothetical protein
MRVRGALDEHPTMVTQIRRTPIHIGPLQVAILGLVAVTALIHLYLAIFVSSELATVPAASRSAMLKILVYQTATRWLLAAYAALTIACYFIVAPPPNPLAYPDKIVEVALIVLLAVEGWRARAVAKRSVSA